MPWELGFRVKVKDLFQLILGLVGRLGVFLREKRSLKDALRLSNRMFYSELTFHDTV